MFWLYRRSPEIQKPIYFILQWLRGEPFKEAWERVNREEHFDREALNRRIVNRFKSHMQYIFEHVPKYKESPSKGKLLNLLKAIKTTGEIDDFLKHLPITEKSELIENPKLLKSDEIERIKTYITISSGTTGQSLSFPKDMRDWAQTHALLFFIIQSHGIDPFAPHIYYWAGHWHWKKRLYYLKKDIALNRLRLLSYHPYPYYLQKQWKLIKYFKPYYIYGIPSGLATFSTYLLARNLKVPGIKKVFCSGEMLYPYYRKLISKAFGTKVIDLYGSAEVGVIGFECDQGHMHIVQDTNYMEVLEDGRILITNLFQKAFAIVRYAIGDISRSSVIWEHDCKWAYPIIEGIEGRTGDKIILPSGVQLPPLAPVYIFERILKYNAVLKYRYILTKEGKLVLYLIPTKNYNTRIEKFIQKESEKLFKMPIEIKKVSQIKPLRGGKERYFVIEQ